MNIIIFRTIVGMLLLVALSCCKQPTTPSGLVTSGEDRPDTVHSIVKATIDGVPWVLETPGILSPGAITSAGILVRTGSILVGQAFLHHNAEPFNNYITLHCTRSSNLTSADFRTRDGSVDALRTWDDEDMVIMYIAPLTITAPFTPDTLRASGYIKTQRAEQYLPGQQPGTFRIVDIERAVYVSTAYNRYSQFPQSNDSSIYASLILTQYDLIKHRAAGRFSFTIIDRQTKQTVEIKDGTFENVPLERTAN